DRIWHLTARQSNVLILGDGELAASVAREFERRNDLNVHVAGFVSSHAGGETVFGRRVLGQVEELQNICGREHISRIVVALQDQRGALPVRDLVRVRVQGVEVEDAHSALASLTGKVWLSTIRPSWFVFSGGFRRSPLLQLVKRTVDLSFGMVGLVLSAPIML